MEAGRYRRVCRLSHLSFEESIDVRNLCNPMGSGVGVGPYYFPISGTLFDMSLIWRSAERR